MNSPYETLKAQLIVWLVAIALCVGASQASMGFFFGYWTLTTWMITLGVIEFSIVLGVESDEVLEDLVMESIL